MCSKSTVPLPLAKLTRINIINTLPGLPITWLLGLGRLTPTRMSKPYSDEQTLSLWRTILLDTVNLARIHCLWPTLLGEPQNSIPYSDFTKVDLLEVSYPAKSKTVPEVQGVPELQYLAISREVEKIPISQTSNPSSLHLGQNLDSTISP